MYLPRLISSIEFGNKQEAYAARYLRAQGLKFLTRNYRSRHGEIDLIMIDASNIVFVEVRYRGSAEFGGAIASVTQAKQRKIRLTAAHFLQSHPLLRNHPCRFDVIGLSRANHEVDKSRQAHIEWIKNAFT